jgi:peptidoglycan hydrolase-like protein with peptidoglycan-binding domain
MSRTLFGSGAKGDIVRNIQSALLAPGFDPHGTDGSYGPKTTAAVQAFQQARGLPITGVSLTILPGRR